MDALITNLKRLRTERLLSQAQLGEAIGVDRRTLIRWEAGSGEPRAKELLALARFYGVSIDQLIGELLPPERTGAFIRVKELSSDQVNYWVAKVRGLPVEMTEGGPVLYEPGYGQRPVPQYCTDWTHAGPIIDRYDIHIHPICGGKMFDGETLAADGWIGRRADHSIAAWGGTRVEAGIRAYLIAEVGTQIMV